MTPKRRWFQFSMRSLFVIVRPVITLAVIYVLSIGPVFSYYLSRDEEIPPIVFRAYYPMGRYAPPAMLCNYIASWGVPDIVVYFVLCDYHHEEVKRNSGG
jgi:hypothetical protein